MSYLMMSLTENFQNIWPVFLRNDLKLFFRCKKFLASTVFNIYIHFNWSTLWEHDHKTAVYKGYCYAKQVLS